MKPEVALEKCQSYLDAQIQSLSRPARVRQRRLAGPAITLSRQTGSGAHTVAEKLAQFLQEHGEEARGPWTVFDRKLVETVCEEHNLPKELARFMPEDRKSYLDDVMEEWLGLHPDTSSLVGKITETILHLAEMGHVILVGRGANIITVKMPAVFHVRLVGSFEQRLERTQAFYRLSRKEAATLIRREDRGRARYLKKHFGCDIEDPLLYHLVVNTDRVTCDAAAELIGTAALRFFKEAKE